MITQEEYTIILQALDLLYKDDLDRYNAAHNDNDEEKVQALDDHACKTANLYRKIEELRTY